MRIDLALTAITAALVGASAAHFWTSAVSSRNFANAVVAFNSEQCPPGWHPFEPAAGRVIMGAGKGATLTGRAHSETGGSESIITSDTVHILGAGTTTNSNEIINPIEPTLTPVPVPSTETSNLPPFIVLTLCAN